MAKQAEDPRRSEGLPLMCRIGSHDPLRKEAEFKGGQERESILKNFAPAGMLDGVVGRQANQADLLSGGLLMIRARNTRAWHATWGLPAMGAPPHAETIRVAAGEGCQGWIPLNPSRYNNKKTRMDG